MKSSGGNLDSAAGAPRAPSGQSIAAEAEQPPARRGRRQQPLLPVLAAFCVGLAGDRLLGGWQLPVPAEAWWLTAWAALAAWAACGRQRPAAAWLVLLSVAAVGGAWHHGYWNLYSPADLGLCAGRRPQAVCVRATAHAAPQWLPAPPPEPLRIMQREDQSRLVVRVQAVRDGTAWRRAGGLTTLLVDGRLRDIRAGDRLRIVGKLSLPRAARNPGEYDFARFARSHRQQCVLRADFPECVKILSSGAGRPVRRVIDAVRSAADRLLHGSLTGQGSSLAAAVLLGAREQIGSERTVPFITTGTVHLLVVSGLHLGILAGGLFLVLRLGLLPRRTALVLVALAVVGYALLTNARPPVVRAAVLVVVVCCGRLRGQPTLAFNCLAAAALVVLALNPSDLFRTGPQLSFLAVAALVWWVDWRRNDGPPDPLDQLIEETRPWPARAARSAGRWALELVAASTVVWFVVQPLIMARFHLLTPVAVLLGPVLWLPVALGLVAGFAVLLFGWLIPPVGMVFAWTCDGCLRLVEAIVLLADRGPGSHFWVAGPPAWWLAGFYAACVAVAARAPLGLPRRWCAALVGGWIAIGLVGSILPPNRHEDVLQCTFLSVGHGCSVVLQLPSGQTILYDTGCVASPRSGARTIAGYLWSQGITQIDAVVLSHADVDHYNALPGLLDRFRIKTVFVSPLMFRSDNPGLRELRRALDAAAVPVRQVWAEDQLSVDAHVTCDVLHPQRSGVAGSDNANSIVLDVGYQGRHILLPGDLERPGLDDLMAGPASDYDVVMAPHHGSRHSSPAEFARWSRPSWVVVSGGQSGRVEETSRAFRNVGARVLNTADAGAITVRIEAGALSVQRWRKPDR